MREIKFRGKNKKTGEWIYGFYMEDEKDMPLIITNSVMGKAGGKLFIDVIPDTVGQYTGLKDTNGKEIYEGDIVTLIREWDDEEYSDVGVIKFHNSAWHIDIDSEDTEPLYASRVYVIGNIHDNPELLK